MKIPIEISARHLHITKAHLEILFGRGYQLQPIRDLSQPGQFAAAETVTLAGPRGQIKAVRILGPCRDYTQVELALTDAYHLGLKPPVRCSGNLAGSSAITLIGPKAKLELKQGAILAWRHIHFDPASAEKAQVKDGQMLKVRVFGDRGLVFFNVRVRINKKYRLAMHLDTDEANAAGLGPGAWGELVKD